MGYRQDLRGERGEVEAVKLGPFELVQIQFSRSALRLGLSLSTIADFPKFCSPDSHELGGFLQPY